MQSILLSLGALVAATGCVEEAGGGPIDDAGPQGDTDSETDGALLGEVSLEDDASHLVETPGAYEWWNFFAVDPVGGITVSMIFNAADPFNCDYRRALYAWREDPEASPAPVPSDYPLLQLQVTSEGQEVFSSLRNPPGTTVWFSAETGEGRIGDSTFTGSMQDGAKLYTLHIDAPDTTNDARLQADIALLAGAPGFTVAGDGMYQAIQGGADHAWQFPLGHPRSSGHVKVTYRDGQVPIDSQIEGGGYTDHMWGRGLLTDILEAWHFGTADLGDEGSLVYVWLTPAGGAGGGSGFLFHEPPGAVAEARPIIAFNGADPQVGLFELPYEATVELSLKGGGILRAALDPDHLAADWPFQVAGPSRLDVQAAGLPTLDGFPGTSEYLWQPGIDSPGYYFMFDYLQDAQWGEDW